MYTESLKKTHVSHVTAHCSVSHTVRPSQEDHVLIWGRKLWADTRRKCDGSRLTENIPERGTNDLNHQHSCLVYCLHTVWKCFETEASLLEHPSARCCVLSNRRVWSVVSMAEHDSCEPALVRDERNWVPVWYQYPHFWRLLAAVLKNHMAIYRKILVVIHTLTQKTSQCVRVLLRPWTSGLGFGNDFTIWSRHDTWVIRHGYHNN